MKKQKVKKSVCARITYKEKEKWYTELENFIKDLSKDDLELFLDKIKYKGSLINTAEILDHLIKDFRRKVAAYCTRKRKEVDHMKLGIEFGYGGEATLHYLGETYKHDVEPTAAIVGEIIYTDATKSNVYNCFITHPFYQTRHRGEKR